jgi:hypothetical protein
MGGTATPVTGWITSDVPATGYLPGNTYTITATGPGSGKKGFEISPQDLAGNLIGTLTAGSGNKLVGNNKYVTHSAAVTTNPAAWTFQWTAPAGGAGDVTFYGSFAVTKTVTKTTTLTISQSTVGIPAKTAVEWSCYPNPAHDKVLVRFIAAGSEKINLDLMSLHGTTLQNLLTATLPAGEHLLDLSIRQPAGMYLLRLTRENDQQFRRIIVQ